jgi:hypothetical protein
MKFRHLRTIDYCMQHRGRRFVVAHNLEGTVMADLQDQFQEVVPFAADKAGVFLNVIRDRGNEAGLGLTFEPKQNRKTKLFTLEAKVQFKSFMQSGKPQSVVVFAEPTGQMLSVGWQLTSQSSSSTLASLSDSYAISEMKRERHNMKPENVRALQAMLVGFHKMVFMPTLHQLADAVDRSQSGPSGGSGFLGA